MKRSLTSSENVSNQKSSVKRAKCSLSNENQAPQQDPVNKATPKPHQTQSQPSACTRPLAQLNLNTINKSNSTTNIEKLILSRQSANQSAENRPKFSKSLYQLKSLQNTSGSSSSIDDLVSFERDNLYQLEEVETEAIKSIQEEDKENLSQCSTADEEEEEEDELNNEPESFENRLSYKYFECLLDNDLNTIQVKYKQYDDQLTSVDFVKLINLVETFNTTVNRLYFKSHPDFVIDLKELIMSLFSFNLTNRKSNRIKSSSEQEAQFDSNRIYEYFIRNLIKIVLTDEKLIQKHEQAFTLLSTRLSHFYEDNYDNYLELCAVILRIAEVNLRETSANRVSKDLLLLDEQSLPRGEVDTKKLRDSLDEHESLQVLPIGLKIELAMQLMNVILSQCDTFKSTLDMIEMHCSRLTVRLEELKEQRHQLEMHVYSIEDDMDFMEGEEGSMVPNQLIADYNKQLSVFELEYQTLSRKEPLGSIRIGDRHGTRLFFWCYNCLPHSLLIEKRVEADSDQVDMYKSDWYLIDDLQNLSYIFNLINKTLIDSTILNGLISIIKKKERAIKLLEKSNQLRQREIRNELTFTKIQEFNLESLKLTYGKQATQDQEPSTADTSSQLSQENQLPLGQMDIEQRSSFLSYLIEFKQRLLTANFLKYEVLCQPGDDEKGQEKITSSGEENVLRKVGEEFIATMRMTNYQVDSAVLAFDDFVSLLTDSLAHKREENIALLRELVNLLYNMTFKKCVNTRFLSESVINKWLSLVNSSQTVRKLCVLLNIFDRSILWKKSNEHFVCNLCNSSQSQLLKITCHMCSVCFHLDCLLEMRNEGEEANQAGLVQMGARNKLACLNCFKKWESEQREKESRMLRNKVELYNPIEISSHTLRLNRNRINYIENQVNTSEKRKRGDDDAEDPRDKDYRLPKIKIVRHKQTSSDEQSDDSDYRCKQRGTEIQNDQRHSERIRSALRPRKTLVKYTFE